MHLRFNHPLIQKHKYTITFMVYLIYIVYCIQVYLIYTVTLIVS